MTTTDLSISQTGLPMLESLSEDTEYALALVLSHLFGGRGASIARTLARILRRYAHTAIRLDDGHHLPAPCPGVALHGRCPEAAQVLTRYDETVHSLKDRWRRHSLESADPLPLDLLRDLMPPDIWPVLLRFITEGPVIAAGRAQLALLIEAEEPVRRRDRRHHENSRTSDAALKSMGAAITALMRTLVDLQMRSPLLGAHLSRWHQVPPLRNPSHGQAATDTTAPHRREVRMLWQSINAELARRLPKAAQVGEIEAIRLLTARQLYRGGQFDPLRSRVLLILIAVVGSRVGAIPRLRRCDFKREHRFPDGSVGPALALRPGKTQHPTKIFYKGLPRGAADCIESYLAFIERFQGPFSPADQGPLLVSMRDRNLPWQQGNMSDCVAGSSGKSDPRNAWIPRGLDPTAGFTLHNYRSFAAQAIRSLDAHQLLQTWRVDATQHWIAEALLDHELGGMDALYGGASKDPDREHLSAIGTRLTWELLTGDAGARRAPDVAAFRQTVQAQVALDAEVQELGRQVDRQFLAPAGDGGDQLQDLINRVEQMMQAHVLVRRERQAYEELLRVQRELDALRRNPDREVLLPDDAPAELADIDLDQIEAEVRAGAGVAARGSRPVLVREWISVQEMRELAGVAAATVPRWLGQGGRQPKLPFPPGDARNPWSVDRVPVDDSRGDRHRRILVAGISETFLRLATGRVEMLEETLAMPGPTGWRREHCEAPLVRPHWML